MKIAHISAKSIREKLGGTFVSNCIYNYLYF